MDDFDGFVGGIVPLIEDSAVLNDGETRRNTVLLNGERQSLRLGFAAEIRGTAAAETVEIAAGQEVVAGGNSGDRFVFDAALAEYTLTREGVNSIVIADEASATRAVISLNDTITLAFADGQAEATISAGSGGVQLAVGGAVLDDDFMNSEVTLVPRDGDPNASAERPGGNIVLLSGEPQQIVVDFDAEVRGTAAAETIRALNGSRIEFVGNEGDRVEFDAALEDFSIEREGVNRVILSRDDGTRASISLNNPVDFAFSDGSARAEIVSREGGLDVLIGGESVDEGFSREQVLLNPDDRAGIGEDGGTSTPVDEPPVSGEVDITVVGADGVITLQELLALGREEPEPLVRIAPVYPSRAESRGIEGEVTLSFDLALDGTPENVVVETSDDAVFDREAIRALERWRYAPIVFNEVGAVAVTGLSTTIVFALS